MLKIQKTKNHPNDHHTITTITQTKMEITRNDIIFNRIVIYRQTKNLSLKIM